MSSEAGRLRKSIQHQSHQALRLGLAIGYKNVGFSFGAVEQSVVRLELRGRAEIEEAIIYHAAAEVGQGTHTVMRQMTAEALGLPIEKVRLVVSERPAAATAAACPPRA